MKFQVFIVENYVQQQFYKYFIDGEDLWGCGILLQTSQGRRQGKGKRKRKGSDMIV